MPEPTPSPAATVPRRLTITVPVALAEAVQFSNGFIVAVWSSDPPELYAWRDLDALREQWPDAVLTWIDEEPDHA